MGMNPVIIENPTPTTTLASPPTFYDITIIFGVIGVISSRDTVTLSPFHLWNFKNTSI